MSTSRLPQIYGRFLRLASSWPVDPLRPKMSFGEAIRTNVGKALLASPPTPAASAASSSKSPAGGLAALAKEEEQKVESLSYKTLSEEDVRYAERAVEALEGLRSGRETEAHPMSDHILRPKSDPEYYERLRKGIEKASQGDSLKPSFANRVRIFFGARPV